MTRPASRLPFTIATVAALLGVTMVGWASDTPVPVKPFAGPGADGFFWYKDPKPTPPPEEVPEPTPAPVAEAPPPEEPPQASPSPPPGPAPFSSAWIREQLPVYLDRAIDEPTEENVSAYFALQRLTLDRSQKFSEVAQSVVMGQALLDESFRRPLNSFGAMAQARAAERERGRVFGELKTKVGIWYFYRSDCGYCVQQGPILKSLAKDLGFTITAISMDGNPPPSGDFPGFVQDQGQGALLGVQATPALFVVKPETQEVVPISQGLINIGEFMDRAILAAHKSGWISDADYQLTKPISVNGPQIDTPEYFEAMRQLMMLPTEDSTPLQPQNQASLPPG